MPYVHIQVTREGVTVEQKEALFKGTTDLLVRVSIRILLTRSWSSRKSRPIIGESQVCP